MQQPHLFYTLNERHEAVPTEDVMEWARWFSETDRTVAVVMVGPRKVSTFAMGIHWGLFETLIFTKEGGAEYRRTCNTWEESFVQHDEAVQIAIARNNAGRTT
jgi:hypothetical protein